MKHLSLFVAIMGILGIFSCRPVDTSKCLPLPPDVRGRDTVEVGSTITLTAVPTGGTWSSSNPANAVVNNAGVVTGIAAGTADIIYTVPVTGPCSAPRGYHKITITDISIGQSLGGGIVAYILQPGDAGYEANVKHGLIAAPTDQANARWKDDLTNGATNATGTAIGTGWPNTNTIMLKYGINGDFAVIKCRHVTFGGNSDWYLPSKDELAKLYANRAAIGGFGAGRYWSSSEIDENNAWSQVFDATGSQGSEDKLTSCSVRAVRRF